MREKELQNVLDSIKRKYGNAECGVFFSRNLVDDPMINIFKGTFFSVDICYYYGYFEVFGCTEEEKQVVISFYNELGE